MFIHEQFELLPDINTVERQGKRYYKVGTNLYPSVTTVLGDVEKPWVNDWRNSLGPQKADKETKRATDRGTAVHAMIENLLNNVEKPTEGFKIEHICEYNSLRLHLKKINNIYAQEIALWSDTMRLAGRVDCIGTYKGKLSIIDFKTSTNNKTSAQIQDYYMQVAAYAIMFQEMYNIQIDNYVIMMSVERGAVPMIFSGEIEPHIAPLLSKVSAFHKKHRSVK